MNNALNLLRQSIELGSNDCNTFFEYFYCSRTMCEWTRYAENVRILNSSIKSQLENKEVLCIDAHSAVFYPLSPSMCKEIAQDWSKHDSEGYKNRNYKFNKSVNARIKIGYVSYDFGNHALSHLFQSIPVLHNRFKFEIYCFA